MTSAPIILGFDTETLRERVDLTAVTDRISEIERLRSLSALTEKVFLYRVTDRIDDAWEIAQEAVRLTRFTGDRETLLGTRILRADLMRYRGKAHEGALELQRCAEEAETHEWWDLMGRAVHNRGRALYEAGEYRDALEAFAKALEVREAHDAPDDELEASRFAAAVTEARSQGKKVTDPHGPQPLF